MSKHSVVTPTQWYQPNMVVETDQKRTVLILLVLIQFTQIGVTGQHTRPASITPTETTSC